MHVKTHCKHLSNMAELVPGKVAWMAEHERRLPAQSFGDETSVQYLSTVTVIISSVSLLDWAKEHLNSC